MSPLEFRARVVGGKNSKRGWWPWQIGLYKNKDEGKLKSDVILFVCWEYGKMTLYCNTPVASPDNSSFLVNFKELTIQTAAVYFTKGPEGPILHLDAAF